MSPADLRRTRPADERDRPAVHVHGERLQSKPERPPFRRIAILASVPGLSRPH